MGRQKNRKFSTDSSFFCIQCGNKGIPIIRNQSLKKETHHRKKLYCIYCKQEVNHIECKNSEEIDKFKENFKKGLYIEESQKSIEFVNHL